MNRLQGIQRGIDCIESRLHEPFSLADVAAVAGFSLWHFQRTFKALAGVTVKHYIRARRLSQALDQLLGTDLRVLDIALQAGYQSQESFARAFRAAFGMSPRAFRRQGQHALFPRKLEIDQAQLARARPALPAPEIRRWPAMTLVGLHTHFYGVGSEKNNVADLLPDLWAAFLPRLQEIEQRQPGVCYGLVQATAARSERLSYCAGAAVPSPGEVPAGMRALHIPAGEYAVFTHRGAVKDLNATVDGIYADWLLGSTRQHGGGADLEVYDHRWHPHSEEAAMDYAIPLRALD